MSNWRLRYDCDSSEDVVVSCFVGLRTPWLLSVLDVRDIASKGGREKGVRQVEVQQGHVGRRIWGWMVYYVSQSVGVQKLGWDLYYLHEGVAATLLHLEKEIFKVVLKV